MEPLKLAALDEEDLKVLSAHVQDAVLTVGDLAFRKAENRFILSLNRLARENTESGKDTPLERRRAALHFDRVTRVQAHRIRQDAKDAILSLMSVQFVAGEEPSGTVELVFSGGGAIRLDVECIEAQLADLGPRWTTDNRPDHALDDDGPQVADTAPADRNPADQESTA